MARREQALSESIEPATVLVRPASPPSGPRASAASNTESFRSARLALGQISADLERLRRHAATLVKGARGKVE